MSKLAARERRLIMIMFSVMICMTIIPIYKNITAKHTQSMSQLAQTRERLESSEVWRTAILSEREGQKVIQKKLKARSRTFDLYALTNQWVKQTGLSGRADLQSRSPAANEAAFDAVQITLKNINMKELIDFLHTMYDSNNLVTVQRMAFLKPSRDGKGLECSIVMMAPKK